MLQEKEEENEKCRMKKKESNGYCEKSRGEPRIEMYPCIRSEDIEESLGVTMATVSILTGLRDVLNDSQPTRILSTRSVNANRHIVLSLRVHFLTF